MDKPNIIHQKKHGGTTCFSNLTTVTKQLGTEPKYFCKYLELTLQRKAQINEQNQLIIKSNIEDYKILDIIFDFVEKFILCPSCKSPEGKMYFDKEKLKIACPCCGDTNPLQVKDQKFYSFLQKNPPKFESKYNIKQVIPEETEESESVKFLSNHFNETMTNEELENLILQSSKKFKLTEKEIVCLLCETFLKTNFYSNFMKNRLEILQKFIKNEKLEKAFLEYLTFFCFEDVEILENLSSILKFLFENRVLSLKVLDTWNEKKKYQLVSSPKKVQKVKKAAKEFFDEK
eukprot:gene4846-8431_t